MIFELFTAYAPTVNTYYTKTQRGVFISKRGKEFRDMLQKDVLEQVSNMPVLRCRLAIEIIAWPPDHRRRDLDNILKGLFDAMTHAGLWEDDSLVDQLTVYRGTPVLGGRIYIKVSEAAPCIPEGMEKLLDHGD